MNDTFVVQLVATYSAPRTGDRGDQAYFRFRAPGSLPMQTGSLLTELGVGCFIIIAFVLSSHRHSCTGIVCAILLGDCYISTSMTLTFLSLLSHICM